MPSAREKRTRVCSLQASVAAPAICAYGVMPYAYIGFRPGPCARRMSPEDASAARSPQCANLTGGGGGPRPYADRRHTGGQRAGPLPHTCAGKARALFSTVAQSFGGKARTPSVLTRGAQSNAFFVWVHKECGARARAVEPAAPPASACPGLSQTRAPRAGGRLHASGCAIESTYGTHKRHTQICRGERVRARVITRCIQQGCLS